MRLPLLSHRSLFRRSALILTSFTLGLLLILYAISFRLNVWPLLISSTQDLADLIVLSANIVESAPASRRAALRAEMSIQQHLIVTEADTPLTGQPSWLPYSMLLQTALSKRLGHDVLVVKNTDIYSVDIPTNGGNVRFSFPHSRIGTEPLSTFALNLLITVLSSIVAALLVACKLTCPLRDLSQAAIQVGQGRSPKLDVQANVQELDELVQCFNTMAQQVHTLINSRTTLLAGISHDLRSPLTRARIAVDLAIENIDPSALNDIDRYLSEMEFLLTEFLDYSRGMSSAKTASADIRVALHSLSSEFETSDPPVRLFGNCAPLQVNGMSFNRVLRNLVTNALRYDGTHPVEIRCTSAGQSVIIEIMDRGPGIKPEDRTRIFEPFVRLEGSRNRATGGSGLGLAIVRDICQHQGWTIELDDRDGGGLTARLVIPFIITAPCTLRLG